jgi:hypothetical protein
MPKRFTSPTVKRFANKARWALLAVTLAITAAIAGSGGSKEFVLELPQGIDAARRVVLEMREVRLPRKAAVIFRARAVEDGGAEVPLGSLGLLAESSDAEGIALHATLRIDVTRALKRWRLAHPEVSAARIRVVPYAGDVPLDLEWSATAAAVKIVAP